MVIMVVVMHLLVRFNFLFYMIAIGHGVTYTVCFLCVISVHVISIIVTVMSLAATQAA